MQDHIGEFAFAKFSSCCRSKLRQERKSMKRKELRKRAAALLLSIGVAVTQLLTWQPATMIVRAEESQAAGANQALVLWLNSATLDDAPKKDAAALKKILGKTNEFNEDNIKTHMMPENSDKDDKQAIWDEISEMAKNTNENSFTVIAYSGHGGANLDGTSYLAAGGVNNISAAELRNHLDEFQGRVLVLIHACYSGGMIMTASEFEDGQETGVQSFFSEDSFIDQFLSQEYTVKEEDTEEDAEKDETLKKDNEKASEKSSAEKSTAATSEEKAGEESSAAGKTTEDSASGKTTSQAADAEKSSSETTTTQTAEEAKTESAEQAATESTASNENASGAASSSESTTTETVSAENTSAENSSNESVITKAVDVDNVIVKKLSFPKVKAVAAELSEGQVAAAAVSSESNDATSQSSSSSSSQGNSGNEQANAGSTQTTDAAGGENAGQGSASTESGAADSSATEQDTTGKDSSESGSASTSSAEASTEKSSTETSVAENSTGKATTEENSDSADKSSTGTSAKSAAQSDSLKESAQTGASVKKTTQEASSKTVKSGNPPQYYFITCANQLETGYSQSYIGTEMMAAFGHAMGYDRNVNSYNVYAADTEASSGGSSRSGYAGDGRITMAELENFFKNECMLTSTPVVYPSGSTDVLFTYGTSAGTPASFKCSIPSEDIEVSSSGEIKVKVEVQNLTNRKLTLDSAVYTQGRQTFSFTADAEYMKGEAGYYESGSWLELKPNGSYEASFTFTSKDFSNGVSDGEMNPYCLKIWEYKDDNTTGNYGVLSFYTKKKEGEGDKIDPDAFSLRQPIQLTDETADTQCTVTKTNSTLPMQIVYDQEYADKYNNAACLLSLYSYDLGTELPSGIHVKKDANKSDMLVSGKNDAKVALKSKVTVFENVRPTHERVEQADSSIRASIYSYVMDTAAKNDQGKEIYELGHYYALEFVCHDDSTGKDRKIYAIIQKTDAADAKTYQIPGFEISYDALDGFRTANGIPAEKTWADTFNDNVLTVKRAGENLKDVLQADGAGRYVFKVSGWKVKTSSKPEKWSAMKDTDKFSPGKTYRCTIQVSVSEGNDSVFTADTWFAVNKHTVENISISADQKTATFDIIHQIPTADALAKATVELYRVENDAVGKKVETSDESLHPGDKFILVTGEDCALSDASGAKKTKDTIQYKGKKYNIYKIADIDEGKNTSYLFCTVWKNEDDSCGCAQTLYVWTTHINAGGGDDGGYSGDTSSDGSSSGDSSSGSSSSSNSSSGSSSSENSSSGSSSGDNASSQKAAASVSASSLPVTAVPTVSAADAQALDAAAVSSNASGGSGTKASSGKSSGAKSGEASSSETSGTEEDIAEEASDAEESVTQSEGDKVSTDDNDLAKNGAGENDTGKNAEQNGHMLWLYLILIWILAVLVGFIIFILIKRRKDKEEE